ncbi:TPA: D-Ala-D-Ala carboxypeptidase family metallohydrolase [Enterobacter cloacae]
MGDLSSNFSRAEFACKCGCGFMAVSAQLLTRLEMVRAHFGKPITITSGCRCAGHNAKQGGKPGSMHLKGLAADFRVAGVTPETVYAFCDRQWPDAGGLAKGKTFTHIDVRPNKARWVY